MVELDLSREQLQAWLIVHGASKEDIEKVAALQNGEQVNIELESDPHGTA